MRETRSIWQKMGGRSLTLSIMFHALLLAVGVIWVFRTVAPAEKEIRFLPASGGGSSAASEQKSRQQQMRVTPLDPASIVAEGGLSPVILRQPDPLERLGSLNSPSGGALSGGQDGSGMGGRPGTGNGPGFGGESGFGTHGSSIGENPFGAMTAGRGALTGTFYDFKQTRDGQPTAMTDDRFRAEVAKIVKAGFKESAFKDYYRAKRELFQTKLHIPFIPADAAPAAFECEEEVQPSRWVAVYRGAVKAPKTGRFRFVGCGDDLLVVHFNSRPVFDYGYTLASTGTHLFRRSADVDGTRDVPELEKQIRRLSPMKLPIGFYKYEQTPKYNDEVGGMAQGPVFSVEAGETYPIEILIGEIPGGYFSVSLLMEEIGADYRKDPMGSPILPLFQLDRTPPGGELKGESPPFDPNGPVWEFVPGALRKDI